MTDKSDDNGDNGMDTFFATVKEPEHFKDSLTRAEEFINKHNDGNRPIVLVTSGGTTVPLERRMIRFLDNFSAGTRGAISAEWFLRRGCAVVFLHRQFSLQPFARHYRHADELVLDLFEVPPPTADTAAAELTVRPQYRPQIASDLFESHQYREELLSIHFYTVSDYLFLLQSIGQLLATVGQRALLYLAAAVSDFYLPEARLSDHKIQSDEGALILKLEPVPKVIRPLVVKWCPRAFVVSFKLETDPLLLLPKAEQALQKYQHNAVIANLLTERKYKVTIISRDHNQERHTNVTTIKIDPKSPAKKEIEELIVDQVLSQFKERLNP